MFQKHSCMNLIYFKDNCKNYKTLVNKSSLCVNKITLRCPKIGETWSRHGHNPKMIKLQVNPKLAPNHKGGLSCHQQWCFEVHQHASLQSKVNIVPWCISQKTTHTNQVCCHIFKQLVFLFLSTSHNFEIQEIP